MVVVRVAWVKGRLAMGWCVWILGVLPVVRVCRALLVWWVVGLVVLLVMRMLLVLLLLVVLLVWVLVLLWVLLLLLLLLPAVVGLIKGSRSS